MQDTKTRTYETVFRDRERHFELGIITNNSKSKISPSKEVDERFTLDHYSQMNVILSHGGYRDISKIAAGGSGVVVSASKGKQNVALKSTIVSPYNSNFQTPWEVLSEEAKNLEFLHEKKVPNLIDFYGLNSAFFDGFYGGFLELELCGGYAFNRNVYPVSKLVTHTLETTESLNHMHEHGLVHGDIKPSNILVNLLGDLRLIDLATARKPSKKYSYSVYSKGFLAPELFYTSMRTESGDVFSLAATLFEAVSGKNIRQTMNSTMPIKNVKQTRKSNKPFNPYDLSLSLRTPTLQVSKKLEYAITSGLQLSPRPNLNEFIELLLRSPEAKDYTFTS